MTNQERKKPRVGQVRIFYAVYQFTETYFSERISTRLDVLKQKCVVWAPVNQNVTPRTALLAILLYISRRVLKKG